MHTHSWYTHRLESRETKKNNKKSIHYHHGGRRKTENGRKISTNRLSLSPHKSATSTTARAEATLVDTIKIPFFDWNFMYTSESTYTHTTSYTHIRTEGLCCSAEHELSTAIITVLRDRKRFLRIFVLLFPLEIGVEVACKMYPNKTAFNLRQGLQV